MIAGSTLRFVVRRVLVALVLVLVASSAALVLTRLAPGGYAPELQLSAEQRAEAARIEDELGTNRPLAAQYLSWLSRALRLDFGRSILYSRPVGDLLGERAINTSILALTALVIATLLGLPLGLVTGAGRAPVLTRVVRMLSLLLISVPPLVGSLVLLLVAARTGWLPVGGMTSMAAHGSWLAWATDVAWHLPVPALALALPIAAMLERIQSQAVSGALREPFVDASRSRGVSALNALIRHAWPVSLGPVLGVYGLVVGSLFSGSFVVEVVSSWPGLGRLTLDALRARDIYLVAGSAATGAACLAAVTLVADLVYGLVDPRVREGR